MNIGDKFTIEGKVFTVVDKSEGVEECEIEEINKARQELIDDVVNDFGSVENFVYRWLGSDE